MKPKLLIIGASVRAQVESAIRAGYPVEGWDLFADHDTRAACQRASPGMATILRIESFDRVAEAVANARSINLRQPSNRWQPDVAIVCGGVEQHTSAIAAIEDWLPIAGCSAESGALLTKQDLLQEVIAAAGCMVAPVSERLPDQVIPSDWLYKPIPSSGGLGIRTGLDLDLSESEDESRRSLNHIFQQRIDGESCSSLYVATDGRSKLVGSTRQLVGDDRLTDSPFAWCGSIGPVRLPADRESQLSMLGEILTDTFNLRGVFGVDFILNDDGIWPVDINARIPGSAEVFESFDRENHHPHAFNMIEAQLGRCGFATCWPRKPNVKENICGKAIVFNQTGRSMHVDGRVLQNLLRIGHAENRISDIPSIGTTIAPGDPITTVQTTSSDPQGVESSLLAAAQQVRDCWT